VGCAAGGDRRALESLLLHFHDPLFRSIQSSLSSGSPADITAEDILQDTLFEAFRGIRRLEPRGHQAFFHWLKAIADSRFHDLIKAGRAQKRGGDHNRITRAPSAGSTALSILGRMAGPDLTPSRIARKKETLDAIVHSLEGLDPLRRQVMQMRFGRGLSLREVADKTGKSPGAVKMLINRSIKDLRNKIAADFGELSAGA
jgi:RNA polymerase sigma factor (sigma-70 family)